MREIIFRGKRIDNGEWVDGASIITFIDNEKMMQFIPLVNEKCLCGHDNNDNILSFNNCIFYKVDPDTVRQYTGLKDKNGKRIFEGDIYHHGDLNIKYIVQWLDSGFKGKQLKSSSYAGLEYWADKIEIIGNIHDNPELLGV